MVLLTLPWIERKGERCYTKCIKVTMLDFQSPQDRWRHRSSFSTSCLSFKGSQNLNHFRNIRKYMYDYAYLGHNLVYAQSLLILGHLVMFIDVHELVCKTVQCLLLYNKKTKKMLATVSSFEHIVKSSWNITGFTYTCTSVTKLWQSRPFVTLPADKGKAVVVMDASEYQHKIDKLLLEGKYTMLSKNPMKKTRIKSIQDSHEPAQDWWTTTGIKKTVNTSTNIHHTTIYLIKNSQRGNPYALLFQQPVPRTTSLQRN